MNRIIICMALTGVLLTGCTKSATTATPPLAPGYSNSTDQELGSTLAAADAFYNKLQSDQKAGTFLPTAAEVTSLNILQVALAAANPVYLAYHNGTATLAQAQAAVNQVSAAQASATALISGGK